MEYNDNIFGSSQIQVADTIARVSPIIRIGMGDFQEKAEDYIALEYQPSYEKFFENPGQSHFNQNLAASGKATFSRYSTDFDLEYIQNNQPNATQTGRQGYRNLSFAWNNSYYVGAKTFVSATLSASNQNYDSGQNYTTYSVAPQLGYAYSPKTTIFAGPYAGIAFIGDGATQTFQGATLGLTYDTLRKLSFQGSVGVQARQFQGLENAGNSNFLTPIFNISAVWKPVDTTTIQLAFNRDVQISDLSQGLTYTITGGGVSWDQRIATKFSFQLNAQYQYLDYQQNPLIYPEGRRDQYILFRPTLSYRFFGGQASVSIYYQRQQRTSDLAFNSYSINIYGFQLLYRF